MIFYPVNLPDREESVMKKKIIWSWVFNIIIVYFLGMQLTYYISGHTGITIDPCYLFYSVSYFIGLTLFTFIVPAYFMLNEIFSRDRSNQNNYSSLTDDTYYKKSLPVLYFDKHCQLTESQLDNKRNVLRQWLHINKNVSIKSVHVKSGLIFMSYKDHVYVDDSDSHSLIIGSSGSGKSFSFILPMLCLMAMTGESGLTVDIKGELSAKTAELFKSKGYDVYFIDFIDPENSDCWNPLYLGAKEYIEQLKIKNEQNNQYMNLKESIQKEYEIIYGTDAQIDYESYFGFNDAGDYIYDKEKNRFRTSADFSLAQEYFRDAVEAITSGKKESREDSFWNEEAGRVLEGYIHLLAESGNIDVINIPAVSRIILEGDEIKKKSTRGNTTWLQYYLEKFKSSEDLSKEKLMSYVDSAEQTRKSSRNVLTKHLNSIIINDAIKNMLSQNDIDLENVGKRKTMIYLKVHDEKQTYYPLVTLFIKQLWQCLVKTARSSPDLRLPIPFHIMFDEMGQFPAFDEITNVLTAGRSRGVRLTAVVQGYDQLDNAYGKNTAKTIKNNAKNTVYLLSGDYETLDELSKRCGSHFVYRNGRKELERVITPDRLQNFQFGEALIIKQREQAFITKVIPFDQYVFYPSLKDYQLRDIPKKEPRYFSIKDDIKEKEENG